MISWPSNISQHLPKPLRKNGKTIPNTQAAWPRPYNVPNTSCKKFQSPNRFLLGSQCFGIICLTHMIDRLRLRALVSETKTSERSHYKLWLNLAIIKRHHTYPLAALSSLRVFHPPVNLETGSSCSRTNSQMLRGRHEKHCHHPPPTNFQHISPCTRDRHPARRSLRSCYAKASSQTAANGPPTSSDCFA
jgi:hypothetical protein